MASPIDAEVIIVGGGIGGLTLAALCRELNITCTVLERAAEFAPVGAGISLSPNALSVLDQLGLYQDLLSHGQKLERVRIWRNNKLWNTLEWNKDCEARFGYPVMSMERQLFVKTLFKAADRGEHVVRFGAKVVDIVDRPEEDVVKVVLESGEEIRGHIVVGADGIRSVIRRRLARNAGVKEANTIKFTQRVHMSGITAPLTHIGQEDIGAANWMLYDGHASLTTWPCANKRQWFIGVTKTEQTVASDRSVWGTCTPDTIKDVHGDRYYPFAESGKFGELVDRSERILASNVFQEVEFPTMASGRICLLGDAAHSMTSAFGQGGNQAIEDAVVLASLMAERRGALQSRAETQTMMTKYSEMREKRTKDVVQFSFRFLVLHGAFLPYVGGLLRWIVYRFFPGMAWLWYLTWLYGYQPTLPQLGARGRKIHV